MFRYLRVQVRTSAPLGVFVRTRTLHVELPGPVTVAPRPARAAPVLQQVPDERVTAVTGAIVRGGGDTVRAVRPYVPGDPARLVHWPTSARSGSLVVREHEPPPSVGVALLVDLNGAEPEVAARRAAGVGLATLNAGGMVWLGTCEERGPVGELIADARDLGRRLARAEPGPLPEPPARWFVEVARA